MEIFSPILAILLRSAVEFLQRLLVRTVVNRMLFEGRLHDVYKTKEAVERITDRYKESIDDVNRAIGLNISFSAFALYAYFALPASDSLEIPLIELSVSRQLWISLAPLISYGLQIFILTSFVWFLVLRQSLRIIEADSRTIETDPKDAAISEAVTALHIAATDGSNFPGFTNILLKGILGHLWMIFRIGEFLKSRLNLIWYYPLLFLIIVITASPVLVAIFFVIQLYIMGNLWLGLIYTLIVIPYFVLFSLLIGITALLGVTAGTSFL